MQLQLLLGNEKFPQNGWGQSKLLTSFTEIIILNNQLKENSSQLFTKG